MSAIFHLPEPLFVILYVAVTVALLGGARRAIRAWEARRFESTQLPTDPYDIAMLRGGALEALKVAVLALIDRGLVVYENDTLAAAPGKRVRLDNQVENIVLHSLRAPIHPDKLPSDSNIERVHEALASRLGIHGLVRSGRLMPGRLVWVGAAMFMPTLLAIGNLVEASPTEARSLGLVLFAWFVALLEGLRLLGLSSTGAGLAALDSLRHLMTGLRDHANLLRPGRNTNEIAMLAAVFGLGVIPSGLAPYATGIDSRMQRRDRRDSGTGSGCGGGGDGGGDGGGCGGCGG